MNFKPTKIITLFVLLFSTIIFSPIHLHAKESFGVWSISKDLFDYIRQLLDEGKTILEFGSGWASGELSKYYTVYSIEQNIHWVNRYNTNYIYAPLKGGWYDIEAIKKGLPKHYDLILVDGPSGPSGIRGGFNKNLDLFDTTVPIIFDDIDREVDYQFMIDAAKKLNKKISVMGSLEGNRKSKPFGIIF